MQIKNEVTNGLNMKSTKNKYKIRHKSRMPQISESWIAVPEIKSQYNEYRYRYNEQTRTIPVIF